MGKLEIKIGIKKIIKPILVYLGLYKGRSVFLNRTSDMDNVIRDSIWKRFIGTDQKFVFSKQSGESGRQRILIASTMGGYQHGVFLESALSAALTQRGAQVEILLCDAQMPACQLSKFSNAMPEQLVSPQPRCRKCLKNGKAIYEPLGLTIHYLGDYLSRQDRDDIQKIAEEVNLNDLRNYKPGGLAIGEHAYAGTLRYFARGDLNNEPEAKNVLRSYLCAGLIMARGLQNLLNTHHFDTAVFNHGLYVPMGINGEVCRSMGVKVVNWNPAYRKHCFIFSHGDTYHHTMISEPVETWKNIRWTPAIEKATGDYLKSRWSGSQDWIWFHDKPEENIDKITSQLGIDRAKPVVSLLTNVMWDAQLHYPSNAFPDMLDWIFETIRHFEKRSDLQLVIRVHPAEVSGLMPSRQFVMDEVSKAFPRLPNNVVMVGPQDQTSTYALAQISDAVLIYNTKTGIEVSSMGIPVIVAGEAWIRRKGFSTDADTREQYFDILASLPLGERLSKDKLDLAKKYAFHFFFRRMIELPFITPDASTGKMRLDLEKLDDLEPGHFPGLDTICEGILNSAPFVYQAEKTL